MACFVIWYSDCDLKYGNTIVGGSLPFGWCTVALIFWYGSSDDDISFLRVGGGVTLAVSAGFRFVGQQGAVILGGHCQRWLG